MVDGSVHVSDAKFAALLAGVATMEPKAAVAAVAQLADAALDRRDAAGLRRVIEIGRGLDRAALADADVAQLDYFLGTAFSNADVVGPGHQNFDWNEENLHQSVLHLRRCVSSACFPALGRQERAQALTNLANQLSTVGRIVEAVEMWRRALNAFPKFPMAQANLGRGLIALAQHEWDELKIPHLLQESRRLICAALSGPIDEPARPYFQSALDYIDEWIPAPELSKFRLRKFSLGRSKAERLYRTWALENHLFLNTLNELGPLTVAGADVVIAPGIVVGHNEGPHHIGFFDALKQEFVGARLLYYESISSNRAHFADRDVLLANTMDYPAHSIRTEKCKAALRVAFSLFDKVAFYLNTYFQLRIPESQVNFKKIWYQDNKREKGLRAEFVGRPNWPLRGLFWISRDLAGDTADKDALEPDAREVALVRNNAEHRYLRVHLPPWTEDETTAAFRYPIGHSIRREDLESKTLRLLKTARAALIQLGMALAIEEKRKDEMNKHPTVALTLGDWRDDWKGLW